MNQNRNDDQGNQSWQPLFRQDAVGDGPDTDPGAEAEASPRSPHPAAGHSMLTKVANLLDDVTEGSRTARSSVTSAVPNGSTDKRVAASQDVTSSSATMAEDSIVAASNHGSASAAGHADASTESGPQAVEPEIDQADAAGTMQTAGQSPRPGHGSDRPDGRNPVNHRANDEFLSQQSGDNRIAIKGRGDGIAIEIGRGDWSLLVAQLSTRLEQAANFFRGGSVTIGLGDHHLTETQLDALRTQLVKYGLTLGGLRTSSERTFEAAVTLGLPAAFEGHGIENRLEAATADANLGAQSYFVFRGNLRSGQILHKTENVIVIGDVNPGAQVISAGDVIVWGRLRGVAHAGAQGKSDAIISALLMAPTQLRVASYIGISNDAQQGQREQSDVSVPETAYIVDGALIVRPWTEARRGFRSVLLP